MVQELDTNSLATLISGSGLVVIDFWATWCGPCVKFSSNFEKIATDFPKVTFGKINVEEHTDAANQYGIKTLPTFKLFKNGQEVDTVVGANDSNLRRSITKHL